MKRLALIAALSLVSTGAWGVEMEVPLNYESAWLKTVQVIALEGIDLSVIDKESGIIQGSKFYDQAPVYLTCQPLEGRATSYILNIAVTILAKDETSSMILVQGKGVRKSFQNRSLFNPRRGQVDSESTCISTGVLEHLLLNKVLKPSGSTESQDAQPLVSLSGADIRVESLFLQLQSPLQWVRTNASKSIYSVRIDNAELYEAVAIAIKMQLAILDKKSPSELQQEVAWHTKALATSGNLDYMPLLDELSRSTARTVAKHAKKSKKLLAKSTNGKQP